MPKDGLKRLPDDIVAPLLRALVTIRPRPESRLYLQRAEHGRAPGWDAENDYNVLFRGRAVGRIWRFIYEKTEYRDYPWHWTLRPSNDDWEADWGHAMTLVEAMEQFRKGWDAHVRKTGMRRARD
jgi:hypothetical protein